MFWAAHGVGRDAVVSSTIRMVGGEPSRRPSPIFRVPHDWDGGLELSVFVAKEFKGHIFHETIQSGFDSVRGSPHSAECTRMVIEAMTGTGAAGGPDVAESLPRYPLGTVAVDLPVFLPKLRSQMDEASDDT